jgi:ribonuclease HI
MIEAWFDGVCEPRNPGGHAAWGVLIKVDGQTVYEASGYVGVGDAMSNNVAEYAGVTALLTELAKYSGVAIIRGDSKLVIMQLQNKWRVNGGRYWPYYLTAAQLWRKEKNRCRIQWIPRDDNDICDVLSKRELIKRGVTLRIQPQKAEKEEWDAVEAK